VAPTKSRRWPLACPPPPPPPQSALAALSEELDRDCFRDMLRAAAAALNRELFNGLATEAAFSAAGAAQLGADVMALLRVFQVCPRPGAGRGV
jgi:hypothetical protein